MYIEVTPYITNKLPSNIVVLSPSKNNTMSTADQAAADPPLFDTDPLQPGEIHLHSLMLYTSQAPILDLTGEYIKTKEDIEAAFHALNLCPQEDEQEKSNGRKDIRRTSKSKSLTDSDTSDDTEVNPRFKTSVEERDPPRISYCN